MLIELLEAAGRSLHGARLEVAPAPDDLAGVSVRLLEAAGGAWEPAAWWRDAEGGVRTWASPQAALEAAWDIAAAALECPVMAQWPAPVEVVVAPALATEVPVGLVLDEQGRPVARVI
jgi:hypothetical protein